MKTKVLFKTISSFLVIFILINTAFSATKGDFTKPYKQEFQINKGALLKINSEFTDIKAYNWDKDIISIEVTVSVNAKNEDKAQSKFNKVSVDMEGDPHLVSLSTGLKSSFSSNGNDYLDIEVLIYYPSHIQLDLENEFGNCLFENIDGTTNIKMAYGDFEAINLNHNELDIDVEFGKVMLQKFQSGKAEVSYGGFNCQYVGMLKLDSEFSSVEIEEIDQIELETGYDKIYIGNCNVAFIDSEFSSVRIDKINKNLEMEIAYGSFNLKSIASDFDKINISSEFTGISLVFDEPLNFAFKASAEMGDFKYPKELAKITFLEKEMMELNLQGYFGNAKDEEPRLILSLENASASVKIKE